MKLIILISFLCLSKVVSYERFSTSNSQNENLKAQMFKVGMSLKSGDIPILNRKIFRGMRVTIQEHPYLASIRRKYAHYIPGTILTKSIILTVGHPLHRVPIDELHVVVGETYSDRGTSLLTVILLIFHEDFNPAKLTGDLALLKIYESLNFRPAVKPILGLCDPDFLYHDQKAFVTGWGRCDLFGNELCLPRSTIYFPDEKLDPMLRTVSFQINKQPQNQCDTYKRLYDINIGPGMLCLGVARESSFVTPRMAVPGAPLIVDARLLGIQSWGLCCGYNNDLAVVYTDIRKYYDWIYYNVEVLHNITKSELAFLYEATKAYIMVEWLSKTRIDKITHEHLEDDLQPLEVDKVLAHIQGNVFDVRNFIYDNLFHSQKERMYEIIKSNMKRNENLEEIQTSVSQYDVRSFLNYNLTGYVSTDIN